MRLLAATAPFLAITFAAIAFLWERVPGWLGALLPAELASAVAVAWLLGAATLLSLTYGSLPFFAHQRVLRATTRDEVGDGADGDANEATS